MFASNNRPKNDQKYAILKFEQRLHHVRTRAERCR